MQQLQINGRTVLLRSKVGAFTPDASPPTVAAPADAEIFASGGHDEGVFYWTATAVAGGTVDLTLWVWDGGVGIWVKAKSYLSVAPNDFFDAPVYNVSQLFWELTGTTGTIGTDFRLRGFAKSKR